MSVTFKPLADRVIIEPAPVEQKTASGIFIPDTAKEKPLHGTIVAVGSGKKDEPMTLKPGDSVLYGRWQGRALAERSPLHVAEGQFGSVSTPSRC